MHSACAYDCAPSVNRTDFFTALVWESKSKILRLQLAGKIKWEKLPLLQFQFNTYLFFFLFVITTARPSVTTTRQTRPTEPSIAMRRIVLFSSGSGLLRSVTSSLSSTSAEPTILFAPPETTKIWLIFFSSFDDEMITISKREQ